MPRTAALRDVERAVPSPVGTGSTPRRVCLVLWTVVGGSCDQNAFAEVGTPFVHRSVCWPTALVSVLRVPSASMNRWSLVSLSWASRVAALRRMDLGFFACRGWSCSGRRPLNWHRWLSVTAKRSLKRPQTASPAPWRYIGQESDVSAAISGPGPAALSMPGSRVCVGYGGPLGRIRWLPFPLPRSSAGGLNRAWKPSGPCAAAT